MPPVRARSGRSTSRRWSSAPSSRRGSRRSRPAGRSTIVPERVRMLFNAKDKAGEFLRATLAPTLVYAARVTPGHRPLDRRRRSRDAVGLWLGPRSLRVVRRDRRARSDGGGRGRRRSRRPRRRAAARHRRCSTAAVTASATDWCPPAAPDLQILRSAPRPEPHRQEERGREPGRSRRRRAVRRVPLEDERHRRRHRADAAGRRQGSGEERSGAGGRQRRAQLLRRRQPDAGAARSAGRQLGRARHDGPRVPAGDDGLEVQRRAGGGGAGRPRAGRWRGDRAARRSRAGERRDLHGAGRSRRRPDSRPAAAPRK